MKKGITDFEKELLESVDGRDPELLEYIPYLLRDLWDLGTPVSAVIGLIRKNEILNQNSFVLDLGCGKGAVSVNIAREFHVKVTGIDGMKAFLKEAEEWAEKYKVRGYTEFIESDIKETLINKKFSAETDLIILGAVGPFFGGYKNTFKVLFDYMKPGSWLITDAGYIEDDSEFQDERFPRCSEWEKILNESGLQVIEQVSDNEIEDTGINYTDLIRKRAEELKQMHPLKKNLFDEYVQIQERESAILEEKIINKMLLLRKS